MSGSRQTLEQNEDYQLLLKLDQKMRGDYFNTLSEEKRQALMKAIFSNSNPPEVIKQFKNFVNLFDSKDKELLEKIMLLTDPFITQLVDRLSFTPGQWNKEKIQEAFAQTMQDFNYLTFKVIIESAPFVKLSRTINQKSDAEIAAFITDKAAIIKTVSADDFSQFYGNFSLRQQNVILQALVDNKLHEAYSGLLDARASLIKLGQYRKEHLPLDDAIYSLFIEEQKQKAEANTNINTNTNTDTNKNGREQLALIRKLPYWPLPEDLDKFKEALRLALPKAGLPLAEALIKQDKFNNDVFKNENALYECLDRYVKQSVANLNNASHEDLIKMYQKIEGLSHLLAIHGKKDDLVFNDPNSKAYKQLQTLLQTEAKNVLTSLITKSQDVEQIENVTKLLSETTNSSPLMIKPVQSKLSLGFLKADKKNSFPDVVMKLQQDMALRLMRMDEPGKK